MCYRTVGQQKTHTGETQYDTFMAWWDALSATAVENVCVSWGGGLTAAEQAAALTAKRTARLLLASFNLRYRNRTSCSSSVYTPTVALLLHGVEKSGIGLTCHDDFFSFTTQKDDGCTRRPYQR